MKILLIFSLCLISDGGAAMVVTGYSAGGVLITCKYQTEYTQNQKYFCKGSPPGCSDQIRTGDKNKWIDSGRFSLFDETKSSEFKVMIRDLTVWDTGTYQCVVDISFGRDIYTPVELTVKEESTECSSSPLQKSSSSSSSSSSLLSSSSSSWSTSTSLEIDFYEISVPSSTVIPVYSTTVITVSGILLLLIFIGVIFLIFILHKKYRMQGPELMTQTSRKINGDDHENDPNVPHFQSRQMTNQSDSFYENVNPKFNQSDSIYHNLNSKLNQSDSVYQNLNSKLNQSDSVYQTLTNQMHSTKSEPKKTTNQIR